MIFTTHYKSPLGQILLAEENGALIGLWLEGQKYFLGTVKEEEIRREETPVFQTVKSWLDRYFKGERPSIDEVPLDPRGSEFAKEVWEILRKIPYGGTMTYGEIAGEIADRRGRAMSAQAVGGAVGHNPISIIIPCHRVVGVKGNLTGYAGGIDKKIRLLSMEGVDLSGFFIQ